MIPARAFLRWGWVLLLVLGGLVPWPAARAADEPTWEAGQPFMQSFTPRDYHADTQCWSVTQDAHGLLYVGNLGVVLEYDGSTWRKIPIAKVGWISRLAYDAATDRVFVGGDQILGYLQPAPGGGRTFVSLLDEVPSDERNLGGIRGVYVTPEGVFFVGQSRVWRWRDGRFRSWGFHDTSRLRSAWTGGSLYVQSQELGLLRLQDEEFTLASTDPLFSHASVRAVIARPDGDTFVATYEDGVFLLRDGVVKPWDHPLAAFLKDKGVYLALPLHDGSLAIATNTAGLVVLGPDGGFRTHVDNAGGLHGNNILCLSEDAEGGLWIGLQSGITRAEIASPLSILQAGPADDLSTVACGGQHFGATVLGTLGGLYRVVGPDAATATGAHLERLPGIVDTFSSAVSVENGLLLAGLGKVVLLDKDLHLVPVYTTDPNEEHLHHSRFDPRRVLVGEENGHATILRLDPATGRWAPAGLAAHMDQSTSNYGLGESAAGDVWIGTNEHGLYHARPTTDGSVPVATSLLGQPGPLEKEPSVWLSSDGGPILLQTPYCLYRLDERTGTPVPAAEYGTQFVDGSLRVESLVGRDERTLWITASRKEISGEQIYGEAVVGEHGQAPTFRNLPRTLEGIIGHIQWLLPGNAPTEELRSILVVGSSGNGVVRLDVPQWEAQGTPRPLTTVLRRAVAAGQEDAVREPSPIGAADLPAARDAVHFEYAVDTLAFGAAPTFQTRLRTNAGAGRWSEWSDRTEVDYVDLPAGGYTFEVQGRTADGQLGSVAARTFRVLPPWHRSPLAYACYALALLAGVAGLVRWRGHQLRRRNAELESLVEARTVGLQAREAELVRARDDAESANRAKSAFLANMSHELRTPLNAILGYSQILAKNPDLSARNREQLGVIGQSGEHLLTMINEVLDLAKVEAGKLTLVPSTFSLEKLLDDVSAVFRPRLAEKGLEFQAVRAPGLPVVVHADLGRLRQVIFNLLSNAVKFTRQGSVRLEVRPVGDGRVHFEVSDTGIGIAPGELRDIFLAFHQAGDGILAAQGTGLGLTISQRIIELFGGRIEVHSQLGQGARFWFEVPLAASAANVPASVHPLAEGQGEIVGYEGEPRRLLIVDDERENRRVLRDFLQPLGFEIEEAADGERCLDECAHRWPAGVLLDLRMGQTDGFEVARVLRRRQGMRALGIIAVSASVFESDRQQAVDAGCDDFVPKPFEEARLLAALGRALGLRWVFAGGGVPAMAGANSETCGDAAPSTQAVSALLELSLRGDIAGLRHRLETLRAPDAPAGSATLVRTLEPLIASFQMDRLHERLLQFQATARGNN